MTDAEKALVREVELDGADSEMVVRLCAIARRLDEENERLRAAVAEAEARAAALREFVDSAITFVHHVGECPCVACDDNPERCDCGTTEFLAERQTLLKVMPRGEA